MGEPKVYIVGRTGQKVHKYWMPDSGEDITIAIQWMMSVYDDVCSDYGEEHGCPYCYLEGTVR